MTFLPGSGARASSACTRSPQRLATLGMPVDLSEALAAAGATERTRRSAGHRSLARWSRPVTSRIHARRSTTGSARDRPAFVPRSGPSPEVVIETIHRAGGLASLAHPGPHRRSTRGFPRCATPASMRSRPITPITMRPPWIATTGWPTTSVCCHRRLRLSRRSRCTAYRSEAPRCRSSRGSVCTRRGIAMPPPERLVQIRQLTKDYRSLRPLRVDSLDLHEGQTLALCGFDQHDGGDPGRSHHRGHRARHRRNHCLRPAHDRHRRSRRRGCRRSTGSAC